MQTLGIHVVCFCSPGACWTSGFLAISSASVEMSVAFSYIFCISATLQGFLIFILMTARDANVSKFWMETFSRRKRQILGESTNNKIRLTSKYVKTILRTQFHAWVFMIFSIKKGLKHVHLLDQTLMISWRKISWNSERLSFGFTVMWVCLYMCLCVSVSV